MKKEKNQRKWLEVGVVYKNEGGGGGVFAEVIRTKRKDRAEG
jgi:hypothetical protein